MHDTGDIIEAGRTRTLFWPIREEITYQYCELRNSLLTVVTVERKLLQSSNLIIFIHQINENW